MSSTSSEADQARPAPASFHDGPAAAAVTASALALIVGRGADDACATLSSEAIVRIRSGADVIAARKQGRAIASAAGFSPSDLTIIATAISEIARNIVEFAGEGAISIALLNDAGRRGVEIVAADSGPGIPDVGTAMLDGYSTGGGLGIGLPGARRLMDEFDIQSAAGEGTTVTMRKWL
ncbi:MAG: anti-sigma regulatory factor [Acidobacteria bacterium]|nr:anti-sigma regulatory factor [Acidobacteriota bacterium]